MLVQALGFLGKSGPGKIHEVILVENIVVLCPSFLLFSPTRRKPLLTTQKSRRAQKQFHNARSLQENNAGSTANQSARTIVAI